MQLFEEPVANLYTLGPAVVMKVEERSEPVPDREADLHLVKRRWRTFGVVIYQCKQKAVPVMKGENWVTPPEAIETRFVRVAANGQGGCDIPASAGRLLGHYREDGVRWWVFLEKVGASEAPSRPAPAGPQKSVAQSPPAPKAPAARASAGGPPAKPPASPPRGSPGSTSTPGAR